MDGICDIEGAGTGLSQEVADRDEIYGACLIISTEIHN